MSVEVLLQTDRIQDARREMLELKRKTEDLKTRLDGISKTLTWQVSSEQAIGDNIKKLSNELTKQAAFMESAAQVCTEAVTQTESTNRGLLAAIGALLLRIVSIATPTAIVSWASAHAGKIFNPVFTSGDSGVTTSIVGTGTESTNGTRHEIRRQNYDTYLTIGQSLSSVDGVSQGKGNRLCTSAAMATLLRRQQALLGKDPTFSMADIRLSIGSKYDEKNAQWTEVKEFPFTGQGGKGWPDSEGNMYQVKTIGRPKTQDELRALIDENPAGVYLYGNYHHGSGQHAIVISDYTTMDDGKIQFYAYDPAGKGNRTRIEDTSLFQYSNNKQGTGGSIEKMLSNAYNSKYGKAIVIKNET